MLLKLCLAIWVQTNKWCLAPSERQALFVRDFIGRGPKQQESVDLVRRMVDAGPAQAVSIRNPLNVSELSMIIRSGSAISFRPSREDRVCRVMISTESMWFRR